MTKQPELPQIAATMSVKRSQELKSNQKPPTSPKSHKAASCHTVRCKDGKTTTFKHYGRKLAMACFCTECLGWEDNPVNCTAPLCPLYPFRKKTEATLKGDK